MSEKAESFSVKKSEGLTKDALIQQMIGHIQNAMDIIDLFEPSRPGGLAFTKLEEAIMWMQVLINNIALKKMSIS